MPISNLYTIDWGDGNITTTETSHEYLVADDYEVKISGVVTDFAFNNSGDRNKILDVSVFGGLEIIDTAFFGCSNFDISATDIPVVVGLYRVFRNCTSLIFNSSIANWDTINVNDFGQWFFNCGLFNYPLTVNTINATDFVQTFFNADGFDQSLGTWDFSSTETMVNFMTNKTAADYSPTNMDILLNRLDDATFGFNFDNATNVNIGLGTIDYTSAGAVALASLISKGFVIAIGNEV